MLIALLGQQLGVIEECAYLLSQHGMVGENANHAMMQQIPLLKQRPRYLSQIRLIALSVCHVHSFLCLFLRTRFTMAEQGLCKHYSISGKRSACLCLARPPPV